MKWSRVVSYIHVLYVFSKSRRELEAEECSDSAHPLLCSGSRPPGERLRWEVGILGPLFRL